MLVLLKVCMIFWEVLPMHLPGPIILPGAATHVLGWAHCNTQVELPMPLPGPIIILRTAVNVLKWAHFKTQVQLPKALPASAKKGNSCEAVWCS